MHQPPPRFSVYRGKGLPGGTLSPAATPVLRYLHALPTPWLGFSLAFLALIALFLRLGVGSLSSWDEAIYAQIAREMVESGDWLTPSWGYTPFFDKPPLYLWLEAVCFRLLGVSEFAARAPSALAGIGVVVLTFLLGTRAGGRVVGVAAAVVLLSSQGFLQFARFGTLDTLLTFCALLAAYAYVRIDGRREGWWYAFGLACALAFLVKSAAVFIPVVPATLGLVLERRVGATLRSRHFWRAVLVALLVLAPWHVAMVLRHGQPFIDGYLGRNILARATTGLEGNTGGPLYYLSVLAGQFFPWVLLLPGALLLGLRVAIRGNSEDTGMRTVRHLVTHCFLILGVYTLVPTKLPWYIVPIYPAAAILVALVLVTLARRRQMAPVSFLWGLCLIAALGSAYFSVRAKVLLATACVTTGVLTLAYARVSRSGVTTLQQWIVPCTTAFLLVVSLGTAQPLFFRPQADVARLARLAARTDPADQAPLIVFPNDDYQPSALFYSARPVIVVSEVGEVPALLSIQGEVRAIIAQDTLPSFAAVCTPVVSASSGKYMYVLLKP